MPDNSIISEKSLFAIIYFSYYKIQIVQIKEVSELPKMLKDIYYLADKQELIEQTTGCEMIDIDDSFVEKCDLSGNEIHIQYKIDFILQTFTDSEAIWRVQGSAEVEFSIPDTSQADWSVFDDPDSDFFEQYEKYKTLVHFHQITYTDIECDTL